MGSGDNGGIPLWAEVKSVVGVAVTDGQTVPYAAHMRANTRLSESRLIRALGMDPACTALKSFLDEDAEYDEHPLAVIVTQTRERWFGLVNPFTADRTLADFEDRPISLGDVVQVFDVSLGLPGGQPDTVMTNLGDRTRAMEMAPRDLIGAVRALSGGATIHDIASPCPIWLGQAGTYRKDVFMNWPPPAGPRIGILTGNGPESGVALWSAIIAGVRRVYDNVPDVFMPDLVVHSVPDMGLSMELAAREESVRQIVLRGVQSLLNAGCHLVTIACNTTIFFESEMVALCDNAGVRFVSIAEAVVPAVARRLRQSPEAGVGLIGIGPVIDFDAGYSGYRRRLDDAGIVVTTCAADEFAFEIKNQPSHKKRMGAFGKLVKSLPDVTVVILALTEASIVYQEYVQRGKDHSDRRIYIDAVQELGAYIAFIYLITGYTASEVCQIRDERDVSWSRLYARLGWDGETGLAPLTEGGHLGQG
ncbi:MAG: hypothetical protein ACLP1Q_07220 [Solirubrobacteraceae bacterium]